MATPHAGFAARFASALNASAMTQSEVAERLGVGQSTVSHWFTGRRCPPFARIADIAKVLGVAPAALAFGDEHGRPRQVGLTRATTNSKVRAAS